MTIVECLHVNPPLIPLKTLMFLIHGGISALLPFMTIHMKDLGFTAAETALILTILPFVSAIGPPIAGTLADKMGNYRVVFAVTATMSVGFHLLLYFAVAISTVSPINTPLQVPVDSPSIDFLCSLKKSGNQVSLEENAESSCGLLNLTVDQKRVFQWDQPDLYLSACSVFPRSEVEVDVCGTSSIMSPTGSSLNFSEATKMTQALCRRLQQTEVTCLFRCQVEKGSNWTCPVAPLKLAAAERSSNISETVPGRDHITTLAIYSTLRLISTTVMWMAVPLLDAVAITMSKQYNGELGRQKMFSQLGFCILPPLVGLLIAKATQINGFPDYGPAFYVFAVMHAIAAMMIFCIKVDARLPAINLTKYMKEIMVDRRVVSLVCAVFICGCGFGFNTGFLFWFMEVDLKSTKVMLGLSQSVAGLFGIPAMAMAGPLIRKFGHIYIFALSILLYSPRYLAMSFIPVGQGYWVWLTQGLEAISHSLMIVTASDYAGILSSKYVASLQGIIFAAHYCFGKGGGSLFGGLVLNYYGSRVAFRVFSITYFVLFVLYIFGHYFFVHRFLPDKAKEKKISGSVTSLSLKYSNNLSSFSLLKGANEAYNGANGQGVSQDMSFIDSEDVDRDSDSKGETSTPMLASPISILK